MTTLLLNTILENLNDAVCAVDPDGSAVIMNRAYLRMHGLSSLEEYLNFEDFNNYLEFSNPDGKIIPRSEYAIARAARGEIYTDYELRLWRKDIDLSFIGLYSSAPIYDSSGKMILSIITLRDITDQKKAEATILRQNIILNAINRVYERSIHCESVEDLGKTCLDIAEELTNSKFGFIDEVGPDGNLYALAMSDIGNEQCKMADKTLHRPNPDSFKIRGLCGSVILSGKSLMTNNPRMHPDSSGFPEGHVPLTAFLCVPFIQNGKAVGIIGVGKQEGGYRSEEQELLEALTPSILEVLLRKRGEVDLHISEKHYRLLYESMHQGVIYKDAEGATISMNPAAERILGKTLEETLNNSSKEEESNTIREDGSVFPEAEHPSTVALNTGQEVEDVVMGIYNPKEQGRRWVKMNAVPVYEKGETKPSHVYSVFNDITKQKIFESRLKSQKELLEIVIDNIDDSIFITNKNGKVIMMNAGSKKQFYKPDGKNDIYELFGCTKYFDSDGNEISYNDLPAIYMLRSKTVNKYHTLTVKRPDKEMIIEVNVVPVYDHNGKIDMTITHSRDITEFVQHQRTIEKNREQLLQAEKEKNEALEKAIQMKDDFLSLTSHEFKTPITVINSAIQAIELLCKDELSDKSIGYIQKIKQNSNRQLKLVNNILEITRLREGRYDIKKKNIDIVLETRLITESIMIFAEQKRINLSFSSNLKKRIIGIDEEKYERILLNILSNAIKFTQDGKSVAVKIFKKVADGKSKVCIRVKDEGLGIPEDKKEFIFERFAQVDSSFSRQTEGTGIGLYLARKFAGLLGGEITCESELGGGSSFTVILPMQKVKKVVIHDIELSDDRLIRATELEFSDIYLR